MASNKPGQDARPVEFVLLATFVSRKAAEHMLIGLGHKFRSASRKGGVSALVISANTDGSLKLTQSRAQTAGTVTFNVVRLPLSWMVGFLGLFSTLKGARATTHAARVREGHAGSDEHAAHAILADAGGGSAIALIRCRDQAMWQQISARADERALRTWRGSMTEFRAALAPGSEHDWVRTALDKDAP